MKIIRWILIVTGILLLLLVLAGFILPKVIDLQSYVPKIERLVTEKTGRSFTMDDNIQLSVFPWFGVRLSNLKLGNPEQFTSAEFVSVKSFEARIKVLPLLKKEIEIGKFVMDSPRIFLETTKSGKGNWEGLGNTTGNKKKNDTPEEVSKKTAQDSTAENSALPITSLLVDTFAITNGLVQFTDQKTSQTTKLTELNLALSNISLDKPFDFDLEARLNSLPLSLTGTFGPLAKISIKEDIPVQLRLRAVHTLDCSVRGLLAPPSGSMRFNGQIDLKSFSPRKLMTALDKEFPVDTAVPDMLENLSLSSQVSVTPKSLTLSETKLQLDDSTLEGSIKVTDFSQPNIVAKLRLDQMDVDRYLPPPAQKDKSVEKKAAPVPASTPAQQTDLSGLKKFTLDLQLETGPLKVANVNTDKTHLTLTGKNGIFHLTPLRVQLYKGEIDLNAQVDVSQPRMKNALKCKIKKIQAGPLLQDAANFAKLEGTLQGQLEISTQGNEPESILKNAKGQGQLLFTDGVLVGMDMASMIRKAVSTLKGEKIEIQEKPKTDFSELTVPFSLSRGIVTLENASLKSPLLRILLSGDANLVEKTLDMRLDPKVVATIKGQGDTKDHSGLAVPLKITGSFSNPQIRPDLDGKVKEILSNPEQAKKLLRGDVKEEADMIKKGARGFLKGLMEETMNETTP